MNPKWLAVVAVVVVVIFFAPQIEQMYMDAGGGGGGRPSFQVAVIYLYNGVVDNNPQATVNKLKSLCEVEGSYTLTSSSQVYQTYSVKSFYQKYGVNLYFSYQYARVAKQISYGTLTTAKTGEQLIEMVITNWVRENPSRYYNTYDNCNILVFVTKTPLITLTTMGMAYQEGYCWASDYNDYVLKQSPAIQCVIAHEIGHLFGGRDHYFGGSGNGLNDVRCLMNNGGRYGTLTKGGTVDTIFGQVDLTQNLHLSWAKKVPRDYFMKVTIY